MVLVAVIDVSFRISSTSIRAGPVDGMLFYLFCWISSSILEEHDESILRQCDESVLGYCQSRCGSEVSNHMRFNLL